VRAVRRTLERELKLRAPDGFELPALSGEPLEPRVFVSSYRDSEDLRLARAGVTLRHRVEHGRGLWQLKLPRREGRLELELAGGPRSVPEEIKRLLVGLLRGRPLVEVARLRTRRNGVRVQDDGRALADVTFDSVSVMEGQRVTRTWEEREVELLEGDQRALGRIEKDLRRAGAGKPESRTKLAQALDLEPESEPAEPLAAALRQQLDRLLAHDPGVRLGDDDEDVHQLRVATRRLRAFLRAARPIVDREWADGLRAELRWLADSLALVRDLDVMIAHLQTELEALEPAERAAFAPLAERLEAEREVARGEMLTTLRSDRYIALLDRLEQPPPLTGDASLRRLFRAEAKRLRRIEPDPDAADEDLHALRIKAKRARYAAELAAPELGKTGERFVGAAKRLQDVLGEHQDSVVAEERIRTLLKGSRATGAYLAAGRLVERQRARRAAARAGLASAWEEVERFS
jgi:CHAD domain-containing protein